MLSLRLVQITCKRLCQQTNWHRNVQQRSFALVADNPFQAKQQVESSDRRKDIDKDADILDYLAGNGKDTSQNASESPNAKFQPIKQEFLRRAAKKKQPSRRESKEVHDPTLDVHFRRLPGADAQLSITISNIRTRKAKKASRQIIVEGTKLIQEALTNKLKMPMLLFSNKDQLAALIAGLPEGAATLRESQIYEVSQYALKLWSVLSTPPGLMAVFDLPEAGVAARDDAAPITVICDNVREPNNLGSIIRTCASIPCQQVIAMKGCCNPWETKALRGGCGAQFQIKINHNVEWADLQHQLPAETSFEYCNLFIAESNLTKVDAFEFNKERLPQLQKLPYDAIPSVGRHNVVIIGGETHGVSEDAYRFLNIAPCQGTFLHIPLAKGVESLNVTAALTLILFELKKRLSVIK